MMNKRGFDFILVPGAPKEVAVIEDANKALPFDIDYWRYTFKLNKLSIPSLAIPTVIKHESGLPAGVLVYGKPNEDKKLLKFCLDVEKALAK